MDLIDVDGVMAKPIVTSHSIDGTFGFCPRKFEFAHVYLQVPDSSAVGMAAEVGTALHEAVQAWAKVYLAPGATQTEDLNRQAMAAGLLALAQWWPWVGESIAFKEKRLASKQRSLPRATALFFRIIDHPFWKEYELATMKDGSAAIEIPWRIIHRSLGTAKDAMGVDRVLVTQGKIDFVLRHKASGKLRVWDLKTSNKANEMIDASYRFSGQAIGYTIVVAGAVGFDWSGTGIDVTYLTCSFVDFQVTPHSYHMSPEEVDDYLRTRNLILGQMMTHLRDGWWPRRQHGCDNFMSACHYMDVCHRRDARFISAWFEGDDIPFAERPRIYEALWTFNA